MKSHGGDSFKLVHINKVKVFFSVIQCAALFIARQFTLFCQLEVLCPSNV